MQVILLLAETQHKLVAIVKEVVEGNTVGQVGGNLQAKEVSGRCKNKLFTRIRRVGRHLSARNGVGVKSNAAEQTQMSTDRGEMNEMNEHSEGANDNTAWR